MSLLAFVPEPFRPKLLDAIPTYDRRMLMADLMAGTTVGVVALPLAMAFAIASGLPPERGLFTAIVAGFLISALGGTRVQIGGPTVSFVVIVSGIGATYGYPGIVYCTLLSGALLIVMGLAKLGALIRFIPFPVTTGFTTGIAVVIFTTQVKDLFGLRIETMPEGFIEKWQAFILAAPTMQPAEAAVGLGTVALVFVVRSLFPKVPAMLVGMVAATAAVTALGLPVETIGTRFGGLPGTLPMPSLPEFDPNMLRQLISPAFTIALLAAIESLLSAQVADGMTGDRNRPNAELVGQGVANMASVVFGGIPAASALARTATNIRSGAKTPVAGMIHSLVLLLLLLLAAPLAKLIPLACLAGILVGVAWNMSELPHFLGLLRSPRSDVAVLLTTFLLTVLVDLSVAVEVGVVLASLLFIKRMAEVTNIGLITKSIADDPDERDPNSITIREVPPGVEVFEISGPFFFGAAEQFKETLEDLHVKPKALIIRMRKVSAIDATGMHVLQELNRRCGREGTRLVLSGVHMQPLNAMVQSGLYDEIGEENVHGHIDDALDRARAVVGLPPAKRVAPFVPTVSREENRKI
ncbi:MAG: sulfate permease [Candidatus Sumerlaeia bacterium]|nr:sulfate permease [Candidatus Sumerlaeia bacterium]